MNPIIHLERLAELMKGERHSREDSERIINATTTILFGLHPDVYSPAATVERFRMACALDRDDEIGALIAALTDKQKTEVKI